MTITFKPIIRPTKQTQNPSHNQLLNAQKHKCFYCGCSLSGGYTRDHLFPKCQGFALVGNMVLACAFCNNKKSDRWPTHKELIRAVALWRSCFKKSQKHRAAIFRTTPEGKPIFKMTMSAEAIADWTM